MARLVIKTADAGATAYDLKLGTNRIGRSDRNDLQLLHPTVSSNHCEVTWMDGNVRVRDCDSTNGTFINGQSVKEAVLEPGQALHVGDVELELTEEQAVISVPQIPVPQAAPRPVILPDGTRSCPNHPETPARYCCTHCKQLLCDACVHKLQRIGGKVHLLCPLCSHRCELVGPAKRKRRTFMDFLHKTLKMATRP